MQCPDCNVVLPAEARFCLSCGARIQRSEPDAPADPVRDALEKGIGFQYRIERLLGRGGMGAVYLAHELALDRDVAIKVLRPERADSLDLRERFRREARTAARLSHPNIVPLYTFGEVAGLIYFVMGYVAGESLAERLRTSGPLAEDEARVLLAAICDALDYAHRRGVVHRDIKPDNILIDAASGAPQLTDFGIAKAMAAETKLTSIGHLMGTPDYMSPEQATGQGDVGPRSDLYSLGVLAYELVSGQRPFRGGTTTEALVQRLTQEAEPLRIVAPNVDSDFSAAIGRCLKRDPAQRWPDAGSLRVALLPTDDDGIGESPRVVPLRVATAMMPIGWLAVGYLALFKELSEQPQPPVGYLGLFSISTAPFLVMFVVAFLLLRREGLDARAIARRALLQPLWWRGWYPRSLRRRGDVWERLPRYVRRVRVFWSVALLVALGLLVPVQVVLLLSHRTDILPAVQWSTMLILVLVALSVHRCKQYVSRTFDIDKNYARKLVLALTSRPSLWLRTPASRRMLGYVTTAAETADAADASPQPAAARAKSGAPATVVRAKNDATPPVHS